MRHRQPGSIATTVGLCLLFITIVVGMFVYSVTRTPSLSTAELAELGVVIWPRPRELKPFELQSASGERFGNDQLLGHWTYIFFGFTHCPDICPVTLSVMAQAQQAIAAADPERAAEFRGVLVTVDPERDTSAVLEKYVGAFSDDFIGVRGERAAVAGFAQDVNVAFAKMPAEDGGYTIDHTGNIVIINPMGHYHGFIKMPHQTDTIRQAFASLALSF